MKDDLPAVKTFIDTNILVYALDPSGHPSKCRIGREALRRLENHNMGVVSTQVLAECFNALTKKIGLDPVDARHLIFEFRHFEVVDISYDILSRAVDTSILNKISIWDAQIAAAAESAACDRLLTEDLNHGQRYLGVEAVNPFKEF